MIYCRRGWFSGFASAWSYIPYFGSPAVPSLPTDSDVQELYAELDIKPNLQTDNVSSGNLHCQISCQVCTTAHCLNHCKLYTVKVQALCLKLVPPYRKFSLIEFPLKKERIFMDCDILSITQPLSQKCFLQYLSLDYMPVHIAKSALSLW